MSGNACNGENGERSPGAGNSNRPFARWRYFTTTTTTFSFFLSYSNLVIPARFK